MTTHRGIKLYSGSELVASLAVHAVNSLIDEPCCPHACAPCAALFTLHSRGALDAVIRPYVELSGADWDWWSADAFYWQWVLDRWCDLDTCEHRADKFDWTHSQP